MVYVVCSHNGVVVVLGARKTKVFGGISPQNGSNNYWIFLASKLVQAISERNVYSTF